MFRKSPSRRRLKVRVNVLLSLIGISLIGYGFAERTNMSKTASENKFTSDTVTSTTDTPSESIPPKDCQVFKSGADTPYRIKISKIGIDSCIQRVAIDQNNNIAAPSNVNLAGWYVNSPIPGDDGVSLIDGHATGRYTQGIFYDLHKLSPGDTVEITRSNDKTQTFRVVTVSEYPLEQATEELFRKLDSVDRQLTLITCSGNFLNEEQTFDNRIVIRAEAIGY